MKKNRVLSLVLVLASLIALGGCGGTQKINIATGGAGGTYYTFGGVLGKVFEENVEDLHITVASTAASRANIQMLADGDVEMALVQNDILDYAYNGKDIYEEEGEVRGYSAMAALYAEACQVIARPGIPSISELKGLNVSVGDAGSGTEFNARQILAAYGISFDDINVFNLGFTDSTEAFKDGRIDAFFCVAGAPTTAIVELSTMSELSLLAIDDSRAAALEEEYPFYTRYTIPAGIYKGVNYMVQTVAVKATLIVSDSLSEGLVYEMTKALFENKDLIASGHDKGGELDPDYAVSGVSVPFHSGAVKYYEEIGVL